MKNLKKVLALLFAMAMVFSLIACGSSSDDSSDSSDSSSDTTSDASDSDAEDTESASDYSVAMITDYGDITDQSFNQTTYEACKEFCEEYGLDFSYYKPADDSTADRVNMVEKAIDEGYNVIVMPGYAFGETVVEVADSYPDIIFVALDVSESDLGEDYEIPSNVYCAVYQEEISGYMAGYAAVKLGYTHLGFLGGMAVPSVIRYGYGYVQGANAAAEELGVDVTLEYVYGNTFAASADVTAYMDNWYQNLGVEVVFACGGSIYASACESAAKVDGAKIIGVDVDQSGIIDESYGEGMTVTSAMKGLEATVLAILAEIVDGNFSSYGGQVATLGMVSGDDPELNYVQIPYETTQWSDDFTQDDYVELVSQIYDGTIEISNDTTAMPETSITVNEYDNIL